MIHGLDDKSLETVSELIVKPLKAQGCRVWVFGSRARGDQNKFSDIDLLFEKPDGVKLPAGFVSEVKENIEESNLIYRVDLVDLADLAQSYSESVMKDRIEL